MLEENRQLRTWVKLEEVYGQKEEEEDAGDEHVGQVCMQNLHVYMAIRAR